MQEATYGRLVGSRVYIWELSVFILWTEGVRRREDSRLYRGNDIRANRVDVSEKECQAMQYNRLLLKC